jgi:hypothetical protein
MTEITTDLGMPRPLAHFADKPFVGCAPQLRRLSTCWSNVSRSAPRVAVVLGETGIGKTHLIAHFARDVHAGGAAVLYGRCNPQPAAPYQPFVDALDHWVAAGSVELQEEALPHLHELGALIPRLGMTIRDTPSAGMARAGLFLHAVVALLERIAAQRTLLLAIDDLQWADDETMLLIRHLVRSLDPASGTLVLGLGQGRRPGRSRALLCELRCEAELEEIHLAGFDQPIDSSELVPAEAAYALPSVPGFSSTAIPANAGPQP